jgi:hypothetical protein
MYWVCITDHKLKVQLSLTIYTATHSSKKQYCLGFCSSLLKTEFIFRQWQCVVMGLFSNISDWWVTTNLHLILIVPCNSGKFYVLISGHSDQWKHTEKHMLSKATLQHLVMHKTYSPPLPKPMAFTVNVHGVNRVNPCNKRWPRKVISFLLQYNLRSDTACIGILRNIHLCSTYVFRF